MTRFELRISGESERKDRLTYVAYRSSDTNFIHELRSANFELIWRKTHRDIR